jgi:hypothetical protein
VIVPNNYTSLITHASTLHCTWYGRIVLESQANQYPHKTQNLLVFNGGIIYYIPRMTIPLFYRYPW